MGMNLRPFSFVLLCVFIAFYGSKAVAWDPTAIVGGVVGLMPGGDRVDEMADLGFAFSDLLEELGVESGTEDEITKAVERLEKLNSKARELHWTHVEVSEALSADLSSAKSLKERVSALRNMIKASKRIAEVMGARPKAGERASMVQSIKVNSMILEELQAQRRSQFLAYMESRESQARRDILLQEISEKHRGKGLWRNP
ncbi:hypothetical protein [Bdellovibrio bacteriovorus]|uniref:hypothetical protein n=1 Tax=Bdellovibrio bacteriovorus TaxID=959 RepID=UPI0035A65790